MANHKSALKRIKQTAVRTERNRFVRGTMRTYVRAVRDAVATGDKAASQAALHAAIRKIDKAATKGVIHRKQASRRISRLTLLVNGL